MRYLLLLLAVVQMVQAQPPWPNNNSTNLPSGTNYSPIPPTRIVRNGVHVLFDWSRATNAINLQSPVVSVVLTNNRAEWSTNMVGSTNLYAHGEIYGHGLWVVCIWFDPNCYQCEYQYTFDLQQTNWIVLGTVSNAIPRAPQHLSTLIRIPGIPTDSDKMFFRLKRLDLGRDP